MSEIQGRIFNFEDVASTIAEKDNLGLRWQNQLYEDLFLEHGVADVVQFRAPFDEPGNLKDYDTPYKELVAGLQKHFNYQSDELLIFLNR